MNRRPRDKGTDREAAHAWFLAVTRPGGKPARCVVCGQKHPNMQAHHVVEQQVLRREFPHGAWLDLVDGKWHPVPRGMDTSEVEVRSLQDLLWDVRAGIPLCPADHERHTKHFRKVPLSSLSAAALQFADELRLQHRLSRRFYEAA